MMNDVHFMCNKISQASEIEQKTLLRAYARSSEEFRIDVFRDHRKLFYDLRQKYSYKLEIISYYTLILSIKNLRKNDAVWQKEFVTNHPT